MWRLVKPDSMKAPGEQVTFRYRTGVLPDEVEPPTEGDFLRNPETGRTWYIEEATPFRNGQGHKLRCTVMPPDAEVADHQCWLIEWDRKR